ncbi:TPA: radical SAM protein, partial [Candidatus Micrarchaeota archaeon]|nr:radical SAM protein [Candidatus Micrarchaeota archaeon]
MVTGRGTVSHSIKGGFGPRRPSRFSSEFRPVIDWNVTRRCNLRCAHCYLDAGAGHGGELGTEEALDVVDQISEVGSPLLIVSGGEPFVRSDIMEILEYACSKGLRVAISTNGTLISRGVARRLAELGVVYVGVSLDSPRPDWHDSFRGVEGSFRAALEGIKNCQEAGLHTGIRYTVTRYNVDETPLILE